MRIKSIFIGWMVNGNLTDLRDKNGIRFKCHEGSLAKKAFKDDMILPTKFKLTPKFNRS